MDSFSSRASIWVATAALKSLSSFRFSSSAFFSSIRASSAGDCGAEAVELLGARICDEKDLVGYDILGHQCVCVRGNTLGGYTKTDLLLPQGSMGTLIVRPTG